MTQAIRYGAQTVELIESILARGVNRAVVLMRHSAREYAPGRHDLDNPLTAEGRDYALAFGASLPKTLTVRAYASPPERCMETAELLLQGHGEGGGAVTRHRALEALGVFYALDQTKMWQVMREAGGLVPYMSHWFEGKVPVDAMIDPDLACSLILTVMAQKLASPVGEAHLDLCVSHDMTLYLMRERLLGEPAAEAEVEYLDGLVLFEEGGALKLASHHGGEAQVQAG